MEKIKNQKGKNKFMIILFSVLGVLIILVATVALINLYMITPTKGEIIPAYSNPKSALLVMDVQNAITKNKSYGKTSEFVERVNQAIELAKEKEMEILYVKNEYTNPVIILLSGGVGKKGTKGVEFDDRLNIVNRNIFTKSIGDSFSNTGFENYLIAKKVSSLYIVGADAAGCVLRTAQGGRNRKYNVTIISDAVITIASDVKMKQVEEQYKKDGIETITLNELVK